MTEQNIRDVFMDSSGQWVVRKPGSRRASARARTQYDAVERAREIVGNLGGGVVRIGRPGGGVSASETVEGRRVGSRTGINPSGPRINAFRQTVRDLDRYRNEVERLAEIREDRILDPVSDSRLRLRRWLSIFREELDAVHSVDHRLSNAPTDVSQAEFARADANARRLKDYFLARGIAETHPGLWIAMKHDRVIDSDEDPSALITRLSAKNIVARLVYQEPLEVDVE